MHRIFVDMDGVIVDFERYMRDEGLTSDEVKVRNGAYLDMPAIPGAIEAVRSLIGMGYEVWIATKPPTGIPWAYSDKAAWVMANIPELRRRIIITHDKGLLGDRGDYLIDDRPHKANCNEFAGELLHFLNPNIASTSSRFTWPDLLDHFRAIAHRLPVKPRGNTRTDPCADS